MFPGQGSQSRGMGGALFDEFEELVQKADKVLGYSIKELCLEDPRRELGKTQFTQPALYVVNALSYFKKVKESEQRPDFLVGHSLGELNALLAAECFDFEVGLKLVQKRGELMSQVSNGAMAAILNTTKDEIEAILKANGLNNIDLANYNTPTQIVISGLIEEIGRAQQFFQSGKMLYYPLNTSGAFHSRFMRTAKDKFQTYLKRFKFADAKIPVVSNVTARPYQSGEIVENLSNQVASMVRWSESIQYLMQIGADGTDPMQFEEIGHGDVLTKIVHTIRQQTPDLAKAVSARALSVTEGGQTVQADSRPVQDVSQEREAPADGAGTRDKISVRKPAAAEKVTVWNGKYPIGTKVKSLHLDYENLETRTAAVVLFGHRAAVYMKGYNGYFDLDEIAPL
jgi:malonyl CoA-acyl carrier protein transacylase